MRIAILGSGSIGRRHLRKLEGLGSSELLAYDPAVLARRMTKEEIGLPKIPFQRGWGPYSLLSSAHRVRDVGQGESTRSNPGWPLLPILLLT